MYAEKPSVGMSKGHDLPHLQKIQPHEVNDIKNMFQLLCVNNSNRIQQYHAIKLFRQLGKKR